MLERKKLLFLIILLLSFFIPPFTSVSVPAEDSSLVIRDVLIQTSVAFLWFSPVVHVAVVILFIALFQFGSRVGRIADAFFGILFIFLAISNHVAVTESYGFTVIIGNLIPILMVGLFWLWEVLKSQNEYVFQRLPVWRYWVLPFAFLSFWFPINVDLSPNFSPLLLLTSQFGVMYCPTTPVIIALLTLIYSRVNKFLLLVTSLVGFIMGLFNAISLFTMPGYTLWNFILHIPLILISIYGLLITRIVKNN